MAEKRDACGWWLPGGHTYRRRGSHAHHPPRRRTRGVRAGSLWSYGGARNAPRSFEAALPLDLWNVSMSLEASQSLLPWKPRVGRSTQYVAVSAHFSGPEPDRRRGYGARDIP